MGGIYGGCVSNDRLFVCQAYRLSDNAFMGQLEGFETGGGKGWITSIEALESNRGKGAGTHMINSLKQNFIQGYGASQVCIQAAVVPDAVGFYKKNGFQKAGFNDGGYAVYQWGEACKYPKRPR